MDDQISFEIISRVVDKYFDFRSGRGGNQYIADVVPPAMLADDFKTGYDEIVKWKAIPSIVTLNDLTLLEKYLNTKLPESYKYFLKHKHFIELVLGGESIVFFRSINENWLQSIISQIEAFPEEIRLNGYIPIAELSDSGVVCFDINGKQLSAGEYPLIWLNHDDNYSSRQRLAPGFVNLFSRFESHLDEWINA